MTLGACKTWMRLLLLIVPGLAGAQQIAIGEYALPSAKNVGPYWIAAGPDGALWFTNNVGGSQIGHITTAGMITSYVPPNGAFAITAGPDGAMWFDTYNNTIGRITTAGAITEYPIPSGSTLWGITSGPDGALWFAHGNNIGRITTTGTFTEYALPTPNAQPYWITTGPDGALWFTEMSGNNIGRITTAGAITEYPVPTVRSNPSGITSGPDGALWFAEFGGKIGRITTSGAISEYPVAAEPESITAGPDGALWFTEIGGKIGRITTFGAITEYAVPTSNSYPWGIATGPDGELWFTEGEGNKIGEVVFVSAGLTVSPTTGGYHANLKFTGSSFMPKEHIQIYTGGVGSAVLVSATADATGSFTATARAPQSTYGPRLFLGVGQNSGKLGAASFFVTPKLVLNPNSGSIGTLISTEGYGFTPLEQIKIYWQKPRYLLGTWYADAHGTFSGAFTFTIPAWAPPGLNTILAVGPTTPNVSASLNVQ